MVDPSPMELIASGEERPFVQMEAPDLISHAQANWEDVFCLYEIVAEAKIRVRENPKSKAKAPATRLASLDRASSVCLHLFVRWVEQQGLIWPAVYGLHLVEYLVLVLDGLAYLYFVIRVFWKFIREITKQTA